jgi:hypothetical protein
MGYVSKGIALCGKEQIRDAMASFDLAFIFSDHERVTADFLLAIKVINFDILVIILSVIPTGFYLGCRAV